MSFKNIVNRWLKSGNYPTAKSLIGSSIADYNSGPLDIHHNDPRAIQFKIISANGGQIVETTKYIEDNNTKYNDERKRLHNLYIIPDGEDITEALGRIVTMEAMR